jgi:hypothetical protein
MWLALSGGKNTMLRSTSDLYSSLIAQSDQLNDKIILNQIDKDVDR